MYLSCIQNAHKPTCQTGCITKCCKVTTILSLFKVIQYLALDMHLSIVLLVQYTVTESLSPFSRSLVNFSLTDATQVLNFGESVDTALYCAPLDYIHHRFSIRKKDSSSQILNSSPNRRRSLVWLARVEKVVILYACVKYKLSKNELFFIQSVNPVFTQCCG